ncbi:Transaldolase [Chlamydiales bacterium STE3]|nr:Transaldolase [Chlamydiales bacterium STE3]
MKNMLEQLREMTTIVVDTGDIHAIEQFKPTDATTNPSLIAQASKNDAYKPLIEDAVDYAKAHASNKEQLRDLLMDKLFVNFGTAILKLIPGRVSTEVDARLSFDTEGSIQKARSLIKLYEEVNIPRERILIKLASTWEGTQAAAVLERENIHCNMTLLFSLPQAIACAESSATLISPFVGRILDWYKKNEGRASYPPNDDPGVKSVTQIYNYFKKFGYKTQIMGASFRNFEEITELAGCDLLTISPQLLKGLENSGKVERKLNPEHAKSLSIDKILINEKTFRWMLNENPMATEKLAEGIRNFAKDAATLEQQIINEYNLA